MQWKHTSIQVTIVSSNARCLSLNELSSALTKHLLLCPCNLSVYMSLHCVYVLKRRNTMWLGSITCAWLARLFGTTPNEEGFKERKMHAQSVCVCVTIPEWNCACSFFLNGHMWLHCSDMLSCPDLRLKTASSLSWNGSPTSFLTQNTCFIFLMLYLVCLH